ncbi:hypothetical protein [Paraglaciecola polaris]|uniref:Uncharacterized protein n=1 Tax=Paraglaciecola polaris LMG 21857 TaxID=1129793 RepID=K6Z609_9ALTE|nr:hypothetical protein [Paraglaciecola polaris]GAC31646.1 hypothetical protein GPLA_0730 [Paraglaciecola polaris LMG 21857]|tara:strand:+ start:4524 stop:4811 length:288 start_codon:yes stop_codon:yes gene_type:complete
MTSDLLFSILPREGKVPIAHDELKVKKIDKKDALGKIAVEDEPYRPDKDDPREKKRQRQDQTNSAAQRESAPQALKEQGRQKGASDDPKFIDIEV